MINAMPYPLLYNLDVYVQSNQNSIELVLKK